MPHVHKTMNAFLTAPYIMIFMRANGLRRPFEGPVPKNQDFFGPLMATSKASAILGRKKSRFLGTGPSNGPTNPFACRKIIMYVRKASAYIVLCT